MSRDSRRTLREARKLRAAASSLLEAPVSEAGKVLPIVQEVAADLIRQRLFQIPAQGLRDVTKSSIRLTALENAGYRTVGKVLETPRRKLEMISGIGSTTALQAIAAARQIERAVASDTHVRLDPDARPVVHTKLLQGLWRFELALRKSGQLQPAIDSLLEKLPSLMKLAKPIPGPVPLFFVGRKRKQAAINALKTLDELIHGPSVQDLHRLIQESLEELAHPLIDGQALWRDYEGRASIFQTILSGLAEGSLATEVVTGSLPSAIAARVNQLELDGAFLDVSLRAYQAFGAKFALVQERTLIGDEMGLGKTIEALAAMAHLKAGGDSHFMVVCPASVVINWKNEVETHSRLAPFKLHGAERVREVEGWMQDGGVAITTYETLSRLPSMENLNLSMLVVDEAHYVKNPGANRSKAVRNLASRAGRVLFLTGTPLENRLEEFKNLLSYLQPEVARRVTPADSLAGGGALRKAVAPAYLRRNQKDVLAELPEKLEIDEWVGFGSQDSAAYRAAVASGNFMAMRRAAFAPGTVEGSAKLARLVQLVDEASQNGWKVLVFSFFLDVLYSVAETLGPTALGPLTGSVAPGARQALVDEFTSMEGPAVLVSQIAAGGVGLNIQAASLVIITEPQWKPTTEDQAIARAHRMGQTRRVQVHRLLSTDSVDQRMLEILKRKSAIFDTYVRRSAIKEASPDAVDISDAEAARQIVAIEQERLGLAPKGE